MPSPIVPLLAAFAISAGLLVICWWIWKQSSVLGGIVCFGLVARAVFGLALLGISFHNLPFLASMHTGDGFWRVAPDAKGYYLEAVGAATHGLHSITGDTQSISFVQSLAVWMMAVGTGLLSALLFSLACYVVSCGLLVFSCRSAPERWRSAIGIYVVGAFACSPMLILYGTQPLKDPYFGLFAVIAAVAARSLAASCSSRVVSWGTTLVSMLGMVLAIYFMAGMRVYYPFLVWCSLGVLFVTCAALGGRPVAGRTAVIGVATLAISWLAFSAGGRDYAVYYESFVRLKGVVPAVKTLVVSARTGFIRTGGASNVTDGEARASGATEVPSAGSQSSPPSPAVTVPADPAPLKTRPSEQLGDPPVQPPSVRARALIVGLATLFVPMTILRGLSIAHLTVGRGMLLITDLDTLFLDATIGLGILLVVRGRTALRANIGFLVFTICLGLVLTGLMAYTVTNYGTLVRLRLMVGFVMWTLPLAVCLPARSPRNT